MTSDINNYHSIRGRRLQAVGGSELASALLLFYPSTVAFLGCEGAGSVSSIVQNKPNFRLFRARNAARREKRTQTKPIPSRQPRVGA